MKGKTKQEKAITLIALIITIVVLLILAVVAINSIQNDGILSYAENAAKDYNQAVKNEQDILQNYIDYLDKNTDSTTYEAYEVGDEVTIGTESFYVIEASDATTETVVLLAKENIHTINLVQSSSANAIAFSSTNYWSTIEGIQYPYDLDETGEPSSDHYAAKAAYDYGAKLGGTGRLMTYNEARALVNAGKTAMIWGKDTQNGYLYYWLGSADDDINLIRVNGEYGWFDGSGDGYTYNGPYNLRPVIEISKSKVTPETAE